MLKKASYYAAGLAAGAVLLTIFFALRGAAPKGLEAVLMAAGVSLAVGGGCGLLLKQEERRHPRRARQERIEYTDERATLIRERAKAQAGNACSWLTMGVAYVLIWQDAPLWQTGLCVGVFCAYHLLTLLLSKNLEKIL